MKNFRFLLIIACIVITIVFSACKKDGFDFSKVTPNMEWNPSIAVPLAYGSLDMRDLMRDYDTLHLFQWDQSGLLYIMYYSNIGQFNSSDKFYLPTQSISDTIGSSEMNLTGLWTTAQYSKTQNMTIGIVPGGSEIDSINIKTATFILSVSSTFLHTGTAIITFPSITKYGQPYTKTVNITSATGTFNVSNVFTDMSGYKMNLTTTGSSNILPVQFQLSLTNSGASQTSGKLSFDVSLNSVKYTSMFGYFGYQQIIFKEDSIDLKMFSEAFQGGYYFEDPRFNVKIKNSYGIPLQFFFTNLSSYSSINNQAIPVTGSTVPSAIPFVGNPKTINFPSFLQIGQTLIDSITLNKNNSNIAQAIGTSPHFFIFGASAVVNPGLPSHNNFVEENSSISADLEVTLPLWGWAKGLALQDTELLDFSKYYHDYQGRMLQRAIIRIYSENGFPIDISMQMSFATYDSITHIYTIKDKLIDGDTLIVPSGITDSEGRVISNTSKIKDIILEQPKLKKLYDDKITHILFKAVLNTHNSPTHSVKFYGDYRIKVHTGIQCDFNLNTLTIQDL